MSASTTKDRFAVILVAAGRSTRFGTSRGVKKPFVTLAGKPIWRHAAERFAGRPDVVELVLVLSAEDRDPFVAEHVDAIAELRLTVCEGGAERADSVRAGLDAIASAAVTHVAVHDAARPCVTDDQVDRVFAAATDSGAALLASPVTATLKRAADGRVAETVPRDGLWAAQTPQAFSLPLLRRAHAQGATSDATDDCQLVERLGKPVSVVESDAANLKVTTPADLRLAEAILADRD